MSSQFLCTRLLFSSGSQPSSLEPLLFFSLNVSKSPHDGHLIESLISHIICQFPKTRFMLPIFILAARELHWWRWMEFSHCRFTNSAFFFIVVSCAGVDAAWRWTLQNERKVRTNSKGHLFFKAQCIWKDFRHCFLQQPMLAPCLPQNIHVYALIFCLSWV